MVYYEHKLRHYQRQLHLNDDRENMNLFCYITKYFLSVGSSSFFACSNSSKHSMRPSQSSFDSLLYNLDGVSLSLSHTPLFHPDNENFVMLNVP